MSIGNKPPDTSANHLLGHRCRSPFANPPWVGKVGDVLHIFTFMENDKIFPL
jgi:hypothetical protein